MAAGSVSLASFLAKFPTSSLLERVLFVDVWSTPLVHLRTCNLQEGHVKPQRSQQTASTDSTSNMDQHHAGAYRPPARRGPSGAWNRLKPVTIDPLDVYGLPSKGDNR